MNRFLCMLGAFLLACAVSATPVPEPFVKGWDNPVDQDKDCKIRRERGTLTIEMPGSDHDYDLRRKRFNAPRLMRVIEGDFDMEVRVRIDCRPSAESSVKGQPSYVSAGFLIIPPDDTFATRLQYRVEGQGDGTDGCTAHIEQGAKIGGLFGVGPLKRHPDWTFNGKPEYVYLRLDRQGNKLGSYISADREKWLVFGGGLDVGLPSKLKIGLAAGTTSTDPSKVVFDQLQITLGEKKRKPWEFVSGWGDPIDPDKDCNIKCDKDALTIEMPGTDHDYDPLRKKFNAPRLLSELKGRFDLQVRVRIDYRPSAQSTVNGEPSFVSAGFLLIYPEGGAFVCCRTEYGISQQGSNRDAYAVKPRLAEPRRKEPVPERKEADSYAVMKTWTAALQRKGNTIKWDHGRPEHLRNDMWERGWQKWPLPEKTEYAYLRLDHRERGATFFISPDGEKWTELGGLPHVPEKGKVGLAAYSTSTEPSKVRFDQLKLWRDKKKE